MRSKTALLLAITLLALAAACCGGEAIDPYVRENERFLDTLPAIPGARRLETRSAPYYRDEATEEPLGYATSTIYRAPSDMAPRDVIEFYTLALRDEWSYRSRQAPVTNAAGERIGRVLLADFSQGAASISIDTSGMGPGGQNTFEVVVDYGGDR